MTYFGHRVREEMHETLLVGDSFGKSLQEIKTRLSTSNLMSYGKKYY